MNLEKAVIELTDRINHAGLNAQVIEERKTYLCLIASILVNLAERNKYSDFLTLLFECPSSSWNKSLTEKLDETAFSSNGHRALFQELIERLLSLPGHKRELLVLVHAIAASNYGNQTLLGISIRPRHSVQD